MTRSPLVRLTAVAAALAFVGGGAIAAEPGQPSTENAARYSLSPVEGGFLRLDTTTGAVSFCSGTGPQWTCSAVADTSKASSDQLTALQSEAAKLREENRALREALTAQPPVPNLPGPGVAGEPPAPKQTLPTEEDVDKAFDYVEGMFKKFRDRLKRLEDESKSEPKAGTL